MSLHPQAQAFIDDLAAQDAPGWDELGVEKSREVFETFNEFAGEAPMIARVEDHQTTEGIRFRIYSHATSPAPVIMFFHGGGWVLGNLGTHDGFCRRTALHSGCAVVAVDYRLSPENSFPGPIEDCYRATQSVVSSGSKLGVDADRLAVLGDSAGGYLAAAVAILARDRANSDATNVNIDVQGLLYPVIAPDFETASYRQFADGFGLTRSAMQWFWQQFLGNRSAEEGAITSLSSELQRLPPAIVLTAEYDVLRDEGQTYADQMARAGVDVLHRQCDGMLHGFLHLAGLFDTGIEQGRWIAEQIGKRLKEPRRHS